MSSIRGDFGSTPHQNVRNTDEEPLSVTNVETITNPKIYNISVASADTEISQTLSASTKRITIRVRGNSVLKVSFLEGESGTNYIKVPMGCSYNETDLRFSGTIYFQTVKASQVVEIIEWT